MTMAIITQNLYGVNEELIQDITARIVREWHPHKIILFGSYAQGKPKEFSDLDFMVIMDSEIARPDERAMQIHKSLRDVRFPVDLLVYTPEEVTNCLQRGNVFIREIAEEGEVLYAR